MFLIFATTGQTYRTGIVEYFNTHDLQKPTEEFVVDENTTICKLKLTGPFTFCDKGNLIFTVLYLLNTIWVNILPPKQRNQT